MNFSSFKAALLNTQILQGSAASAQQIWGEVVEVVDL